ncbi:hypothetical protein B0H14DRAFT_2789303 [Mycena olivaceomarginata]|nr:hypothetical protein B0H14DRAFT_2789303 [Mycena olivaceomarginata]
MSSPLCNVVSSVVSSRRPSLAMLYNNLKAQSDPYEELEDAARLFPMEDDEIEPTYTAPSVSSLSPPSDKSDDSASERESSDSDSDVEPFDSSYDVSDAPALVLYKNAPFMPLGPQSPRIAASLEPAATPRKAPASRRPAPASSQHGGPSQVDEDSDQDADGISTGDASDDEYVPLQSLNSRKGARSAPHALSQRSSKRPHKRTQLSPILRNKQATVAQIRRVENSKNFVCEVCGWVQKKERITDFNRHLKTHQRTLDENAQKGWRCKGVRISKATTWGLPAHLPTYIFLDDERVGGCMKTFSRRDALKRHLDNKNVSCIGRP